MPTPVTMPQLGESVTEGTVARWLKREGERVERDEPLLEVTTDKVNADMPSPIAGVLVRRLVEEGAVVPVGAAVAEIDEAAAAGAPDQAAAPAEGATMPAAVPSGSASSIERAGQTNGHQDAGQTEHRRYSPLVRKLAAEHGIDQQTLASLQGSGLGGRVTKDDVLAYLARAGGAHAPEPAGRTAAQARVTRDDVLSYMATHAAPGPAAVSVPQPRPAPSSAAAPAPAASPPVAVPTETEAAVPSPAVPSEDETRVPLTAMRRGIAEHMLRSKHTAPHATTVTEVDMTRLVGWRAAHKASFRAREGVEITYLPFVIQAAIDALKAFPVLNAAWGGDAIILKRQINIGIAVGLEDGLLVPVIHRADERSLVGLARAAADLAERARAGRLRVDELQGGTFTVNNTGVFGSIVSTPVINQPQAAILSMEAIVKRPVVIDDAIAIRSMMNICLSFDHRIVDGLMAGRFNQRVKQYLEHCPLPS